MTTNPKPQRIQRKRTKGWKMPPNTVTVDRSTIFGNPFKVVHVKFVPTSANPEPDEEWHVENEGSFYRFKTKMEALTASINLFRTAANRPSDKASSWRRKVQFALRGKDFVACWCPLDQPCHADVLLEIANEI
jgi:uncharacterized protein DUF4326